MEGGRKRAERRKGRRKEWMGGERKEGERGMEKRKKEGKARRGEGENLENLKRFPWRS